jgi:hypothetical protein
MMGGQGCLGIPSTKGLGPITAWQQFPMVIGATTTAPTKPSPANVAVDLAWWRKNGQNMEITYDYRITSTTGGATGTGTYLFPLPSGYHVDTSVKPLTNGGADSMLGLGWVSGGNANELNAVCAFTATALSMCSLVASPTFVGSTHNTLIGSATTLYSFSCSVPILEWRP